MLAADEPLNFKTKEKIMNTVIMTNDRFDRLCNNDISTHYRDIEIWLMPSSFLGAFAYWVVAQNPNDELIDIVPALSAFKNYIFSQFANPKIPKKFTFKLLSDLISEEAFEAMPDILALNELKPDFIDLGALARNVFYMILRECITQD